MKAGKPFGCPRYAVLTYWASGDQSSGDGYRSAMTSLSDSHKNSANPDTMGKAMQMTTGRA